MPSCGLALTLLCVTLYIPEVVAFGHVVMKPDINKFEAPDRTPKAMVLVPEHGVAHSEYTAFCE